MEKEVDLPFYFQSLQDLSHITIHLAPVLVFLLVNCAVIAHNEFKTLKNTAGPSKTAS